MFTSKISGVTEDETTGEIVSLDVQFKNGKIIIENTYLYADYLFATKTDVMNMLISECDKLNSKYGIFAEIKDLIGVEDAVASIKSDVG